jgi:SNF2 family DNA or RNA helicase
LTPNSLIILPFGRLCIFLNQWWNTFADKYAIAVTHWIGQDKPITVIRYISKDTIEEKVLTLQEKKQMISDNILKFEASEKKMSGVDLVELLALFIRLIIFSIEPNSKSKA